jgi:hypothetical protein
VVSSRTGSGKTKAKRNKPILEDSLSLTITTGMVVKGAKRKIRMPGARISVADVNASVWLVENVVYHVQGA